MPLYGAARHVVEATLAEWLANGDAVVWRCVKCC